MTNFDLALWSFPVLWFSFPTRANWLGHDRGGCCGYLYGDRLNGDDVEPTENTDLWHVFKLFVFNHPVVFADGTVCNFVRHVRPLFKTAESFLAIARAVWRCQRSGPVLGLARFGSSSRQPQQWARWPCLNCAASAILILSTGALAAGGTLGILIPPSVILVIMRSSRNKILRNFLLLPYSRYFGCAWLYNGDLNLDARLAERAAVSPRVAWRIV